MLKQLAPMAVMPPSPNKSAWITSATVMAIMAAHGPSRIATSTPPTAWPVEPPGIGTLNIMITKLNAAPIASSGTCFMRSVRLTMRAAAIHSGIMTANSAPLVGGPR